MTKSQKHSTFGYSDYDLLKDEMSPNSSFKKKLFQTIIPPRVVVYMPKDLHLRIDAICHTISEKSKSNYTIHNLLKRIIYDFIENNKTNMNVDEIYRTLVDLDESPLLISYYDKKKTTIVVNKKKYFTEDLELKFIISRKNLLLLEILLDNINKKHENKYTVENMFMMLFFKFEQEYQLGLQNNTINALIEELTGDDLEIVEEANNKGMIEKGEWVDMGTYFERRKNGRVIRYSRDFVEDVIGLKFEEIK